MNELIFGVLLTQVLFLSFIFKACKDITETKKTHKQIVKDFEYIK